jgi:hypothetical protein
MKWIGFIILIELGWLPINTVTLYDKVPAPYEKSGLFIPSVSFAELSGLFSTTLCIDVELFGIVRVGGDVKTYVHIKTDPIGFVPIVADYGFSAGLVNLPVSVFWRHRCMHPVMVFSYQYDPEMRWEGVYDEFGIRLEAKIGAVGGK